MKVLVLGGYGLIGSAVVRRLLASGHEVVGLGRDTAQASRTMPAARWITADLATLRTAAAWAPLIAEAAPHAVVNCAGALQDGARDAVGAVQSDAIRALVAAAPAAGVRRFVQVSAPRAERSAETEFMRSKGEADAALAASPLEWTILRPGLVLAPQAYGGTALLRAVAALPVVMPLVMSDAVVQTVSVDDVAGAVARAVAAELPSRRTYDLVEAETHTLADVTRAIRAWLGLAPVPLVAVPAPLARGVSVVADALSWLGWRSPLRSTAMTELAAGIRGDAGPWREATGQPLSTLAETLSAMPATVQERWFSRLFLLKPLAIATLAGFWIVTGLVTLADIDAAAEVLTDNDVARGVAQAIAFLGALADIGLGLAIMVRRWLKPAALGMIALTFAYLAGGTVLAPDLWADPLGPLVKAVPALVLAVVALALAEDR